VGVKTMISDFVKKYFTKSLLAAVVIAIVIINGVVTPVLIGAWIAMLLVMYVYTFILFVSPTKI
jgi:Ca2+/Na+ antiporter